MNKNGRISPKVNYHRGNWTWKRLHQESMFEQMCHYMPIIHLQTKPFLHTFKVNCAFWTVISTIHLNFQLAANAPVSGRATYPGISFCKIPFGIQNSYSVRILFLAHGFNVVRLNPPNSSPRWCILVVFNLRYFNLKLAGNSVNSSYGSLFIFPVISPPNIPFSLIPKRKTKNMFVQKY